MRVQVLPSSGSCFPAQLALINELSLIGSLPDIILATSGGNASAYLTIAADWSLSNIERIVKTIHPNIFANEWSDIIPTISMAFFKCTMYNKGVGVKDLYKAQFTKESITRVEIWTGTMNRDANKAQFFCNRSCPKSIIKPTGRMSDGCLPLIYLDGNIDDIAIISHASASIPTVVPEIQFKGINYSDGGVFYSSPLSGLRYSLLDLALQNSSFHIDYISSFDMSANGSSEVYSNILDNFNKVRHEIVKSLSIQDRDVGIQMLETLIGCVGGECKIEKLDIQGNLKILYAIECARKTIPCSVLELYPHEEHSIDLTYVLPSPIMEIIVNVKKNYNIRFWYPKKFKKVITKCLEILKEPELEVKYT